MDPTNKVAKNFPDVKFEHATGYKRDHANVTTYSARFYEGRYVIGQIAAEGHVRLTDQDHETTTVEVEGGSQLTGRLASMGQRLLSGVARMFTNQFFKALEREVSIRN